MTPATRIQIGRALLMACVALLIGTSSAPATVHEVEVGNYYFSPTGTTVRPGDTVRWLVADGTHRIKSDTGSAKSWDSGVMDTPGQSFEAVFRYEDGMGPFPYRCVESPELLVDTIFTADTCWAWTLDRPYTVADLVYAIRVVLGGIGTPPDDLYRFDLDGNCVIDSADVLRYICYFQFGGECFPPGPVATCCYPTVEVWCPVPLAGDLNQSGEITSADIIAMINTVFRGVEIAGLCAAVGDVNCSGDVTSADIIAAVNYVFKGGTPPCDICELIPDVWSCQELWQF